MRYMGVFSEVGNLFALRRLECTPLESDADTWGKEKLKHIQRGVSSNGRRMASVKESNQFYWSARKKAKIHPVTWYRTNK